MKEFNSAAEHRAYVDGAGDVINFLLNIAAELWKFGRDSYDLERLRVELNDKLRRLSDHIKTAQEMED